METLNKYLSGTIMPILLIILGIFFAFKLKFFYLIHPIKTISKTLKNQKGGFKSLSVALAGTLGIGNIVGVSSAILLGGAGSIFWMWVSALCAMSLKYAEVFLAMRFRRHKDGNFYGGAPYYIADGLKKKIGIKAAYALSIIFAIFCIVNSLTTGNLVQINSVSSLLPFSRQTFGILFTLLTVIVTFGGLNSISKITSVLIPFLSLCYVLICIFIIFLNFEEVPKVLANIITDAFSLKSTVGGFMGFGISKALRFGVSRGVLSNEAGCGTSPMAHASSDSKDPHSQACLGILEVFIDTILLCTLTAFVILIASPDEAHTPMNLVLSSFEKFTGSVGVALIVFLSISFAFATVICQFFYGAEALNYISKSKIAKTVYNLIFYSVLIIGAIIPMELMWQISDLAISAMTVVNLVCLLLLHQHINN